MNSLTISPRFQPQYQAHLEAVKQQADGLKKQGNPGLVSDFLENSVTSTIERYEPNGELRAYASMVKDAAFELKAGERADLAQGLWDIVPFTGRMR